MGDDIVIIEREMSAAELARMNAGFDAQTVEFGNPLAKAARFGFVAEVDTRFAGCSSGLAYLFEGHYGDWFYLTDLFVERPYRGLGLGGVLLGRLEERVAGLGMKVIWTWTATFEAPAFYKKQGYEVMWEQAGWYPSGHGRVALCKKLR